MIAQTIVTYDSLWSIGNIVDDDTVGGGGGPMAKLTLEI